MCGIAAVFTSRNKHSSEIFKSANQALAHRGPDAQNVWIDPNGYGGLAHARLSLLDLSTHGTQPLTWRDGNLKLVHNGEFYDFERIKKDLSAKGHVFQTGSDSEILLPLYEEYGTAALSHLRGEFAFVLWDRANRQVFAARDRFGIKPLYYACHEGSLYFASEVKALFAMGVPACFDSEMFYQYQTTWHLLAGRTLYQGVYQIPPGHFLIASHGTEFLNPKLIPYWDFNYPVAGLTEVNQEASQKVLQPRALEEALQEEVLKLRELLLSSISLRLRADVPVACYLSGGLDSCSILGAASQLSSQPIHAFTLSFPDEAQYDEGAVAREMAEASHSVYHEIPIRWAELTDHFSDALWHAETPFINTHGVAKYLLSRNVRDAGFKAVLTGEGSDEIFGGYLHFRTDYLNHHAKVQGSAQHEDQMLQLLQSNSVSRPLMVAGTCSAKLDCIQKTLGYVPSYISAFAQGAELARDQYGLFREEFLTAFQGRDSWRVWLNEVDVSRQLTGRSQLNQSLYLWSRNMLPTYLLTVLGDRMEMAHSIEGRVPFLDHVLVEHVAGLPIELKIQNDLTEKYLLREAAKPFLTNTVYKRQKHPFLAPPSASAPESALFQLAQDTFRSCDFAKNSFYSQKKVIELMDQIPKMDRQSQSAIDSTVTLALSCTLLEKRMFLE